MAYKPDFSTLLTPLSLLLLTTVFCLIRLRMYNQKPTIERWQVLWNLIRTDCATVRSIRRPTDFLVNSSLIALTLTSALTCTWFAGVSLSYCAFAIGSFNVGERIFQLIPDPLQVKDDMSFAGVWIYSHASNASEESAFRSIVSTVYGNESKQASHLLLILGENHRSLAIKDFHRQGTKKSKGEFQQAQYYFEMAAHSFELQKNHMKLANAMSNVSFCQFRLGSAALSHQTVLDTLEILKNVHDQSVMPSTLSRLAFVESLRGNQKFSQALYARSKTNSGQSKDYKIYPQIEEIFSALTALLILIQVQRWLVIQQRERELKRKLHNSKCAYETVEALNKLTALELFRGRLALVQKYSEAMLKAAEG